MKKITFLVLICMAAACSTAKHIAPGGTNTSPGQGTTVAPPVTGADGTSFEKAIVIQEKSEMTGGKAEYKWLKDNYPGYKMIMQALGFF